MTDTSLDPGRFRQEFTHVRGFRQAFIREGLSGKPLLLVHGWPETSRIWWRNIEPLARAGFEVIVPDLRGHGSSEPGPDGHHDVPSHSRDLSTLVTALGHRSVVALGGDLGGVVIQDMSARYPGLIDRAILFNTRLPYDKASMAGLATRPPREVGDYYRRQGLDADALVAELRTRQERRDYIATFYGSRLWAHPGSFDQAAVDFMTEPFADARQLRAGFGFYESLLTNSRLSEPMQLPLPNPLPTMILFGASDVVMYPEFDRMAAVVFPDHVGPFLLRDCGHFVQWEAASQLNTAVTAWCS
ncbi:alpha/beta hydrolase [Micromonospora globispora]|uniref:alpha/beta fold hydrolase n=1 Tax=Micromonospora globispora TaxID=1450148 RepID=UPI000D6EDAD9|nr:alpha/beta hydrolase [Micromonospora globispora]PWU61071.1 alpha/beta hydrolase [Micromonospora globispora]RQW98971.1 alpha/beta hydrolase [Micromonospora globispora]